MWWVRAELERGSLRLCRRRHAPHADDLGTNGVELIQAVVEGADLRGALWQGGVAAPRASACQPAVSCADGDERGGHTRTTKVKSMG